MVQSPSGNIYKQAIKVADEFKSLQQTAFKRYSEQKQPDPLALKSSTTFYIAQPIY